MQSDIGVCTHPCSWPHVCVLQGETLVLVFVLVPGVHFLLNIFPSNLFIYTFFFLHF